MMKHKKTIIISVVVLAVVFLLIALSNSTYALFATEKYGDTYINYSTGLLDIDVKSKTGNISLTNTLPMTDTDGLQTTPYIFTIENVGNLNYEFDVQLLSVDTGGNNFLPQYIRLQIDDGDVVSLSELTSGLIKENVQLAVGKTIEVSIRIWLSYETPNTELGKSFNSKIVVDGVAIKTEPVTLAAHITDLYKSNYDSTYDIAFVNNEGMNYYAPSVRLMNDGLDSTGVMVSESDAVSGTAGNIRYYGTNDSNLKNYIYFNCADYLNQSNSTCETWRIIGIVDGKVKIIKNDDIGVLAWDYDKNTNSTLQTYSNNWEYSSLQDLLNESYYNGDSIGEIPYYSMQQNGPHVEEVEAILDMNTIGIKNDKTRNLISTSIWYLGGYSSIYSKYANDIYTYERTNSEGTTLYSGNSFNIERNIGLMYASDYSYASDLNLCKKVIASYSSDSTNCTGTNWLYNETNGWTISQNPGVNNGALNISGGDVNNNGGGGYNVSYVNAVRPTLYLNERVKIIDGDGSSATPYQIST